MGKKLTKRLLSMASGLIVLLGFGSCKTQKYTIPGQAAIQERQEELWKLDAQRAEKEARLIDLTQKKERIIQQMNIPKTVYGLPPVERKK